MFIGSAGFLMLVAFVAGALPAWRASRVDPAEVRRGS
jgi:ABC-type lipoprotein release transport system permease subunit